MFKFLIEIITCLELLDSLISFFPNLAQGHQISTFYLNTQKLNYALAVLINRIISLDNGNYF